MTTLPVTLKPGPIRIAAAGALAGFSQKVTYPAVTDGCGVKWNNPSALLIAVCIAGAEASGHAWVYNVNYPGTPQESTDYGLMEINNRTRYTDWFKAIGSPTQLLWNNYADNMKMAYQLYKDAIAARKAHNAVPANSSKDPATTYPFRDMAGKVLPLSYDWHPWNAYNSGHYLRERIDGRSWVSWAKYGVDMMNVRLASGQALERIASIDLDPYSYWQNPPV